MKILNPAALKRAALDRLGTYLVANGVGEITIVRDDGVQTMKLHNAVWRVTKAERQL